jgi:HEAT repeat protein
MRNSHDWKQWFRGRVVSIVCTILIVVPAAFAAQRQFDAPDALATLTGALSSADPAARAAAACELGRLRARPAIPYLIALLEDGTPLPPQIFCGTQPPFEDESWAPDYPEVLEPSPGEAAARSLIAFRQDAIVPLKQVLVGGSNWRARKNASWALAHLRSGSTELVAALKDPAWQVRAEAAYALFQSGGNSFEVLDALSNAVFDNAWQVREQALFALGHKNGSVDVLFAALRDNDDRVRLGAARALGNRVGDLDVQRLITARYDPDPRVRGGVREALRIVVERMHGTQTNLTRISIPMD